MCDCQKKCQKTNDISPPTIHDCEIYFSDADCICYLSCSEPCMDPCGKCPLSNENTMHEYFRKHPELVKVLYEGG